jgi:hypothetical protein
MTKRKTLLIINTLLLSVSTTAFAELYVFPAKGQTQEQMEQDKFSCYGWAKNQTGFDPMNPPKIVTASTSQSSALGGAARGAAGGAIIGAIAGNAGKGAAIGGAVGGVGRGLSNRSKRNEQEQNVNNQAAQISYQKSEYDRAYAVCLEGKGYSTK